MREIKFRCFNTSSKQMIYNIGYHPHYAQDEDGVKIMSPFLDFPLMQYTGLKDKNGVEIYEGDIVKEAQLINGNFVSKVIRIFEVIYKGVSFQYQPIPKSNHTVSPIGSEFEIIGNIYKNPELLNG